MNGSSDEVSLIIFAILAVFVAWKLRSVLGTRVNSDPDPSDQPPTGREPPRRLSLNPFQAKIAPPDQKSQGFRWRAHAAPGSVLERELEGLASADPTFDPDVFLAGAAKAYEMIVTAFAKGDREVLSRLSSPEVLRSFDEAIADFQARGETRETTIVSGPKGSIQGAHVADGVASVTVRFESQLISQVSAAQAQAQGAEEAKPVDHMDDWTFARALGSRDPNWLLVGTQAVQPS